MNRNRKYLTVQEFAKYQGVAVKTIKRWVKSGKIPIIKNKGESKYRNTQNYIHYTQLNNTEAQEEFIQDRGLASKEKSGAPKAKGQQYRGLTAKQQERFDQNNQVVKLFLDAIQNLPPGRKTGFTKEFAKIHKWSEAKLRRLVRVYLKDGIESLIPRWNPGTQNRKFGNDKEAVEFVKKDYMRELGPTILESYQRYCEEFKDKRDILFSLTTYADFIHRNWSESERLLSREPDQWQKQHGIYVNRDWDQVALNECWVTDSKQIDICCSYNNKAIFIWFTAFLDAKSRKFVGWVLTATPDKWAISQAFDNGIATHGVPKNIYCDRGKPFKSYMIAGGKLKARKIVNLFEDIEEEPFFGVFRELGCDIFFAYPRNAKEKIIEPAFGIFTDRLRHLPGYRGHSIKHRPLKLEREIKQGKILTFEQLCMEINKVIEGRNARPHSTTKKAPNDFYKNYTPITPSEAIRAFLKMDRHWVKIRNSGVKIGKDFYRGEGLWKHSGEKVECRRDPSDIRKVAVIQNNKLLEIAHLEPAGHYRSTITLKNRETVAKINQHIRRERKKLIAHEKEVLTNPDPLKVAMEMDEEVKLKHREIRPASNVRSIHQREKLAREAVEGLKKDHEIDLEESTEREIATAHKPSIWSRYMKVMEKKRSQSQAPQPQLRLIPRERLTMYQDDDED